MSYQSDYRGEQVDEAVRRALVPVGGGIYSADNTSPSPTTTQGLYVPVVGATALFPDSREMDMPMAGRLRHVNGQTNTFLVHGDVVVEGEFIATVRARIHRNGDPIIGSGGRVTMAGTGGSPRTATLSLGAIVELEPGDYLDIRIANWTGSQQIVVSHSRLIAFRT